MIATVNEISSFHKLTLGIPISLNSETEIGLTAIRGIGPKPAKNILEEKDKRGGFKSPGDLITVPGIGVKNTLELSTGLHFDFNFNK